MATSFDIHETMGGWSFPIVLRRAASASVTQNQLDILGVRPNEGSLIEIPQCVPRSGAHQRCIPSKFTTPNSRNLGQDQVVGSSCLRIDRKVQDQHERKSHTDSKHSHF
jgi:hypothetical protein